ncbi:MAG TPA: KilA-N domain-containing protein [Allosphingosinicella sp.]|jgi:hypothetical protein
MSVTDSQIALVPHSYQGAVIQQRLNDGYINATAMCKAAGKEWANYNQNASTREFLAALERSLGIPRDLIVRSILAGPNEHRGTWVHPQVAMNLAQWLSPEFAVLVSEWVFDWLTGNGRTAKVWKQFQDRVSLTYDNVPAGYFCVFREIADVFAALFSRGVDPGTRMILDISVGLAWASHFRDQKLALKFGDRVNFPHYYPDYFPQAWSNPQTAWCYPDDALPVFRRWMTDVYISKKLPVYLRSQVEQNKITAKSANNTLVALQDRQRRRALPKSAKV